MYGQPTQSYRLGDHARANKEDGDYPAVIQSLEAASAKDGGLQVKATATLTNDGSTHSWYYNINEKGIWAFFRDIIAAGADPNYDAGPPTNQYNQPRYPQLFSPLFVGRAFMLTLKTGKGDYQNTSIRGPIELGPNGQPLGGGPAPHPPVAPAPASPPFPAAAPGNAPAFGAGGVATGAPGTGAVFPEGGFMRPHTGPGGSMAPSMPPPQPPPAAAPSAERVGYAGDVSSMFRGQ